MRELRDDLGFRPHRDDLSRAVLRKGVGLLGASRRNRDEAPQRYGGMPDGFADYLDPKIDALIADLNAIAGIAREREAHRPPSP